MSARQRQNGEMNKLSLEDRAAHDWYRFVLSYPPHLVYDYLQRFNATNQSQVLDPFSGTGTTLVECKKQGIPSVGIEANKMAYFAASVKVDWSVDPDGLLEHAQRVADASLIELENVGIYDNPLLFVNQLSDNIALLSLPQESLEIILKDSISPLPLHKTLILLDNLKRLHDERYYRYEALALAKALVGPIGNLHFGPEVGVSKPKIDAPVIEPWLQNIRAIANDIRELKDRNNTSSIIHHADARQMMQYINHNSIDIVITSPPYPNEKDYTRTTRLESVILGFLRDKSDLRLLKSGLMRSNTRNVYKWDNDDQWVTGYPEIQRIANEIEEKRIALGKTSGFEKLYGKVTKLYFGGMARHFAALRHLLRKGAHLAYVVGDQASYLQIMIRTGELLADIAYPLGYEIDSIDLFRTRIATATKEQLREEVVVLRWEGQKSRKYYTRRNSMSEEQINNENDENNDKQDEKIENIPLFSIEGVEGKVAEEKLKQYDHIIERLFRPRYEAANDATELPFTLREVEKAAVDLNIELGNSPDVAYTYRTGRSALPKSILEHGNWAIGGAGKGKYKFIRLNRTPYMTIPEDLKITRILDSTPQIVLKYQSKDEQGLLARVRYNRLIDTFTGLTTYHLQGHFRTTVENGQVEIDDLYIGIDTDGKAYILPVEAKSNSPRDQLGVVQITQMVNFAHKKFPDMAVRPIGVKILKDSYVFLEFNDTTDVDLVATARFMRYELYREK